MTAERLRAYRFSTEAQWSTCLFAQADRGSPGTRAGLRPFPPYGRPATRYEPGDVYAPAVTRFGEIFWRDGGGRLYRMDARDEQPESFTAPFAIANAKRIVANASGLWVAGVPPEPLHRHESDTLTRLATIEIQAGRVVDITGGGQDALYALTERGGTWQSIQVKCGGHIGDTVMFEGISDATAFVYLKHVDRFVVLAGKRHPRLYWFLATGGTAIFSVAVGAMRPCFTAEVLGSDMRSRAFLAGIDGKEFDEKPYVVLFDGDGNHLGDLPLDDPATGIAAWRDLLWITTARGLLRFAAADTVPEDAGDVESLLVTPVLYSPDREDGRRWLRIEASASLPLGTTLAISYAATDDIEVRDRLVALAADTALPASRRARKLLSEPSLWNPPIVFHGGDASPADGKASFSAPLFDVHERYVWVSVALAAAPGAKLPLLSTLSVLYPGRTLMENLPAIYQRAEAEPKSFLRALVGVLESTTQDLDARIGALGGHVHPATATPPWLDFIARWLGLPWDDSLSPAQKKRIVGRASDIAQGRGTRAGLEALLDSLMPGTPRRFRVTDATADFGFAIAGGEACDGSALPALLGSLTRWSPELGASAVLDRMRLPCAGQLDDGAWQIAGKIRIEVAASAEEREAWEPWLSTLVAEMLPLTTSVQWRWVTPSALRGDALDDTLALEAPPAPHLGTSAVTGAVRLPEGGSSLSATGPDVGTRLH